MLSSKQIRSSFIDFFKSKGHEFVPSSSLIPAGDETLLFTNAGMNQFKDIFLGLQSPPYRRVVNSQKCLRVSGKHNDLEQVGKDGYHHTFFEMLGNWSFDDYFKAEAIEWAWELLTKQWGIKPESLWATVFAGDSALGLPKDEQAEKLWIKVTDGKLAGKVLAFGRKDNFWEMGDTGPCGPCSEIHIDLGPEMCDKKGVSGHKCGVNSDCGRFVELWNLVFIQYNRTEDGHLIPLGAKYIDTGAGLERIAAVLQGKKSNYDTDLFMPIINAICELTSHKYTASLESPTDTALRVISDHIRCLTFAIADGVVPSNEGRGYVIRRLLRRASRFGRELGMHQPFMYKLVEVVVDCLGDVFEQIREKAQLVSELIRAEEVSFGATLDRGIELFEQAAERARSRGEKIISGEDAFQLYDTYGFPLDLTSLMAAERGLGVDTTRFDELMQTQRERARTAQKSTLSTDALAHLATVLPKTEDEHKYHTDTCDSLIVGFTDSQGFKDKGSIKAGAEVGVVLDKTCFYAQAGGQIGDRGIIQSDTARFIVNDTVKIADCVIHQGKLVEGTLSVGEQVVAIVSEERQSTRKNHTATHLLQWALRAVLGQSVTQQGSFVGPDYLRFDFSAPGPISSENLKKVEQLVRERIQQDSPVTSVVMEKRAAQNLGAIALFGEKYGDKVRVVAIGLTPEDFRLPLDQLKSKIETQRSQISLEFCGGTHVNSTGCLGGFKILKEESVSAGIRRITALTGSGLMKYLDELADIVDQLSDTLKVPADQLVDRTVKLLQENKKLTKQLKSTTKGRDVDVLAQAKSLLEKSEKIGETLLIVGKLPSTSVAQGRICIDSLKKKAKSAAIVFGFEADDKAVLLTSVTDDLIEMGLKASDIAKQIAPIVGGGGGGRAHLAQAGGKNPQKISDALNQATEFIKTYLAKRIS